MLYSDRSFRTIALTLIADAVLFAATLSVALIYRTSAVLSVSLYQVSDVVSGLLLLYAIYSSLRPADETHPFGYGLDRFFWSFVSGVFVFSVCGAISVFVGLAGFLPNPVANPELQSGVLALTVLASIFSLAVIRRSERKAIRGIEHFHQGIRTVFFQDVMSIVSSIIALPAVLPYFESLGNLNPLVSEINGVLLMATGIVLSVESRDLLIGRGLRQSQLNRLRELIAAHGSIRGIRELKSIYIGPDSLLIVLRINFEDRLSTDEIEKTIDQLQQKLRAEIPELKHVIVEPES